MWIITIIVSMVLSVFSTAVMSYISMATPIGPWIAPTLVLSALLLFRVMMSSIKSNSIALATAAGSIGGILATGFGFSFPALYFLDPNLFNSWMSQPLYFAAVLTALALVGGLLGMWVANVAEQRLLIDQQLAFPIGILVSKMISAITVQIRKAYELMAGFIGTAIFCVMQDGLLSFKGFIPRALTLIPATSISIFNIPTIRFDLWPLVWAIGFVTGHVIAIPLLVGAIAKIVLIDPLNNTLFSSLTEIEFVLAFCSGMIVSGTVSSFWGLLKELWRKIGRLKGKATQGNWRIFTFNNSMPMMDFLELGFMCIIAFIFMTYFEFSLLAQITILLATMICAYQIAAIAGKTGLALLGRYATFVMVPCMLLFGLNMVQTIIIATLVEVAGGVTTDILFSRKMGQILSIDRGIMKKYQYLGIVVSSLSIGVVFWLLINHFQLGTDQLFAQKAQGRQLLIDARQFNMYVLLIGAAFGWLLSKIKVNASLVFGGLLMPINLVIGLVLGGLCAQVTTDKEEWYPFWSGVFASNSIWMLLKTVM
jgi:hypothetical protein